MMHQVHGDCPIGAPTLAVPLVLSMDPQLLLTPSWGISQAKELLSLFPCALSCIWGPWGQGEGMGSTASLSGDCALRMELCHPRD